MQYKDKTRETLLTFLHDYLQRGSEAMFVYRRGLRTERWSYKRLVLTAWQTARELRSREIRQGDRVLLCGDNSPQWAAVFWGCLSLGVVVVPLEKDNTFEFAESVQRQTAAKLMVVSGKATAMMRLKLPHIDLDDLSEIVGKHSSEPLNDPVLNSSTLAEIIFTSGTTSVPKGVMLTHGNLLANLLPLEHEIQKYLRWERLVHPLRFLNLVPLSHIFGQMMGLFVPQLFGSEVYFLDSFKPTEIVELTRKQRISVIILVPRLLESLQRWVERGYAARGQAGVLAQRISLAKTASILRRWWMFRKVHHMFGWKFWAFVSGGATLSEETAEFWQSMVFAVLQGYGLTETAALISVTHPFQNKGGSIGKLMPGYELKLGADDEIVVRGPSVSTGYWSTNGEIPRGASGWLDTGDVGSIDESGHLHFKGRKKDVIVTSAGLNIYPEDLEAALNRQPEIRSSCVIRWPGPNGDEPLAVLILNDWKLSQTDEQGDVSPELKRKVGEIIERVNAELADYQQIRRWHLWAGSTFPLTATQKVIRREVAAEVASDLQSQTPDKKSLDFVLDEVARISGREQNLTNDASLKLATDLKLDSLGRIELLSALEDRYQVDIDENAFTEATTLGEVEQIVRGEVTDTTGAYPYPTWSHRFPFTWVRVLLFYTIILPITWLMARMKAVGTEHIRQLQEPVLFISNHITLGDHALILAALPVRLRHHLAIAMDGERLRGWIHPASGVGLLKRIRLLCQYILVSIFFHVFPLPKKSGFRRSFAYAAECVDRNFNVLVFPEGERAPSGQMHMSKFKPGIGLLAVELGIPVVPVKISGLYELKRRRQYFAPPGMVSVTFGQLIRVDKSLDPFAIAESLQRRMEAL